jgi:glycosyltransferase involved in cell wall biosynthesis
VSHNPINFSSTVSVCLATYNGERFILDQVNSILTQLGDADELIISDNGSTDATLGLLAQVDDVRLRIVCCRKKGVVANFENALLHAHNHLIVLSDQDDVWCPGRLAEARASLEHYQLSLVGLTFVNEKLEPLCHPVAIRQPVLSLSSTLLKNGYTGCGMAFRRELLGVILPFPVQVPMHDWWIAAVALGIRAPIHISMAEMILYRRHGANVSTTGGSSGNGWIEQLLMRLNLVSSLMVRLAGWYALTLLQTVRSKARF